MAHHAAPPFARLLLRPTPKHRVVFCHLHKLHPPHWNLLGKADSCFVRSISSASSLHRFRPISQLAHDSRRLYTTTPHSPNVTKPKTTTIMAYENFEQVLAASKYPAKEHAKRAVQRMRENGVDANGIFYFESTMTKLQENNDSPEHFRQRRFFYYVTGCNLADSHYIYDIQTSRSILFIPPVVAEEVIWSGIPTTTEDALKEFDVDEVRPNTEVNQVLAELAAAYPNSTVYTIDNHASEGINTAVFSKNDPKSAKKAIETCRVVKDEYEIAMIRKANYIACLGHEAVIKNAKSAKTESELEAAFRERCIAHGAKEVPYHPIVAAGSAGATLHYVDNTKPLEGKLNLLIDAGCEYNNYASDITRTFPLNGKFTQESRNIYDIVYKMITETSNGLKGGILYDDLHVQAHKIAIDGLLALGILKGDKDEIFAARTSAAFFPHGLGHHLGLDCHDTGGNQNRQDPDKLYPNLRLRGTVPTGSVVTIEPGIYFCEFIIKPFLSDPVHSKFIDAAVLDKYWTVGGIRIENNIVVTESGHENLTTAPMTVAEIEALAA